MRKKEIKIRLTEEEHQDLLARCGDVPLATYLRQLGLQQEVVVKRRRKSYTSVDPTLIHQLSKLGNNVNQIARVVNTYKHNLDKIWLLTVLNGLREVLEGIRKDNKSDSKVS